MHRGLHPLADLVGAACKGKGRKEGEVGDPAVVASGRSLKLPSEVRVSRRTGSVLYPSVSTCSRFTAPVPERDRSLPLFSRLVLDCLSLMNIYLSGWYLKYRQAVLS